MRTSIQVLSRRLKNVLSGSNEIMFERLIKEIDRMNKLVSDLLDYSKRSDVKPEIANVYHIVSNTLALLDNELKNRNISVNLNFENKELTFYVDVSNFNQIILNVIKNAMDAVEANSGEIRIIGRTIDESSEKGELNIFDNGTGIEQSLVEKVFDPFFTTKSNGTGLGLSVVHELVQQNDGEIDIKSIQNEGTKVSLRFTTVI
jgi:signal transduction histidine kinase